ncbi:hypothetical protein [Cupriavidus sp. TMH.W2]|uniref:hypothetical protein n=1 Tax=Cupriavidus sp. TMH.W2 TaxID=3434465 RepID=UPI003D785655
MELKKIEFATIAEPGWVVVQEARLEPLVRLAAAAQSVLKDWPQVLTDEDMDGSDAVDWIGDLYRKISEIQGMCAEPVDADDVAEWVGLHSGQNYHACTSPEKVDWIRRYQESHQEHTELNGAAAGDSVGAPPSPGEHEYAFDVKLACTLRVNAASKREALEKLRGIDANEANLGVWSDGSPILAEVSLDDSQPYCFQIDGEPTD